MENLLNSFNKKISEYNRIDVYNSNLKAFPNN